VILTRTVASRELVARRCALAMAVGMQEGMDLAHARSMLPAGAEPIVEPHRPERDEVALTALARRALRFSPLVSADPPDGLVIDATGTERLHRGEETLVRAVRGQMRRLGFDARVCIAPTPGCAWAVARYSGLSLAVVRSGREREALTELPPAALRIDGASVLGLSEIGITRVGELLKLPRASLAARFDASVLRRLLQAVGDVDEPVDPVRPLEPVRAVMVFDGPTDRWESVEAAVRQTLDRLVRELTARERGVRRLDLELARPRPLAPACARVDLSRPSRSAVHLWSLVRARLERVDLGEGVEGVTLTAARTARLRHEQHASRALGADERAGDDGAWGELVDTLASRLGADAVVRAEPVESHLPERAFRERSAMEPATRGAAPAAVTSADRPALLLPRPEPAEVMALTPDGPVLSLGWRGERWLAVACTGPERIGQEWWRWRPVPDHNDGRALRRDEVPPDRDYFCVQLECGRRLWMFRHLGTGRWFVHGEWS
jgi:protein ImuB